MSKFIIIAMLSACSSTKETTNPMSGEVNTTNTELKNKLVEDISIIPASNTTITTKTNNNSQKTEDQIPSMQEFLQKPVEKSETTDANTDTTSTTTESKD
jgi:hypothetical protein